MRRRALNLVAALLSSLGLPALAQDTALPKQLDCTFANGTVWALAKGAFAAKPTGPFTFMIGDIDLDTGVAMLKAREGTSVLKIVRAIGAHHFIEVSVEGFLNLTTVYEPAPGTKAYAAAHSRHLGLVGEPIISQYVGSCTGGS